tara:strand:+ start:66 stop:431 length:366 start_codon:yes stop_codon:yes gene_type:complete
MKQNSESLNKINPNSLQFSEKAINHFKSQLIGKPNISFIRIGVREAGCSGYEYFFEFEEMLRDSDTEFVFDDCKIIVDETSLNFMKGSLVEYSEDGLNKGITFKNPNAKAVCGCGESFTVE